MYGNNHELIEAIVAARRADATRRSQTSRARAAPGLWRRVANLVAGHRTGEALPAPVSLDARRAEATECCPAETTAA